MDIDNKTLAIQNLGGTLRTVPFWAVARQTAATLQPHSQNGRPRLLLKNGIIIGSHLFEKYFGFSI
jgi:hypothetical protein